MNKATEGKHLSKLRFNAVDVLIVALLVCAALVWAVTYFFESNIQNRFTLVLQRPSASTEQVAQSDFQAKKDTKVYDPETGKQLGVLLEDYDRATGRLSILLEWSVFDEECVYYYGQTVGVQIEKLVCRSAEVIDIQGATENG